MNQPTEFDILEMYYNETKDYDTIADRFDVSVLDVANVVNEELRRVQND